MKLEILGSLFAMLFSLFVTAENNPLTLSSQAEITFHVQEKDEKNFPISIYRDSNISKRQKRDITQDPPAINTQSAWVGCLCDELPLYALNSSAQLPLASVTKIMTVYLALRELGPDHLVTVSSEAVATEGVAGDLAAGETFTVKDLATMAMAFSSNDAAMALAEALGRAQGLPALPDRQAGGKTGTGSFPDAIAQTVFSMNEEAFALGMHRTFFQNPIGLDLPPGELGGFSAGPSNFSTAEDLAILLEATRAQPLLWDLSRDPAPRVVSKDGVTHELLNLNPFRSFPHYMGGKTGTTDFAGENLVILFEKPLGTLYALILSGAPPGQRETEAQKLLNWISKF